MNDIPRFLKEFSNFQKKNYLHNELIKKELKDEAVKTIDKTVSAVKRRIITINEAVQIINNPLK